MPDRFLVKPEGLFIHPVPVIKKDALVHGPLGQLEGEFNDAGKRAFERLRGKRLGINGSVKIVLFLLGVSGKRKGKKSEREKKNGFNRIYQGLRSAVRRR